MNESVIVTGITIIKRDLADLLSLAQDMEPLTIESIVHPRDKQSVPLATKFYMLFIEVVKNEENDSIIPFRLQTIYNQLQIMSGIIEDLLHF